MGQRTSLKALTVSESPFIVEKFLVPTGLSNADGLASLETLKQHDVILL